MLASYMYRPKTQPHLYVFPIYTHLSPPGRGRVVRKSITLFLLKHHPSPLKAPLVDSKGPYRSCDLEELASGVGKGGDMG